MYVMKLGPNVKVEGTGPPSSVRNKRPVYRYREWRVRDTGRRALLHACNVPRRRCEIHSCEIHSCEMHSCVMITIRIRLDVLMSRHIPLLSYVSFLCNSQGGISGTVIMSRRV